jgi:hypothetical protein
MSPPDHGRVEQRGGTLPRGTLTFAQASRLPGLAGKNHMTLRRALEPVRVGRWLPDGERHWQVLYDAERVREIARALKRAMENPYRVREEHERRGRPLSKLPHGSRAGWATSEEIQQALHEHGIDGTYFMPRWLRERLHALGVPSEQRVVTRAVQRVFPVDRAIAALKADLLVRKKLGR